MRITSAVAHRKFEQMVAYGQEQGVDMKGWRFGQFYGNVYHLERPHSLYPELHTSVGGFLTPREAYEFMEGMISAFYALKLTRVNEDITEFKAVA